ncbi:DUF1992 domain-containing protein [Vibrio viridaestus]|uniref:DUF1992 domain-containing protein n=2 Tax=Vibrio viridaestus TaxID=2487322 RepID=A0A3N9TI32_9VIBR|nr:DUF1992 domain-containing protein [Vibrio viridaestus]
MAERAIQKSIEKGDLDNLPGRGKPLELEDETFIPEELRSGYRMLKNAGYLPPELEQRNHAIQLCDLINSVETETQELQHSITALRNLELKMRMKGINTRFIYQYLTRSLYNKTI